MNKTAPIGAKKPFQQLKSKNIQAIQAHLAE